MINSRNSASIAEKQYNHYNWPADDPSPPKRNYFVPHFGEDPDISSTKANLASTEKAMGHTFALDQGYVDGQGSYGLTQIDSDIKLDSDPVCSSAGCT